MNNPTSEVRVNPPFSIEGMEVIYHVKVTPDHFGLTHNEALFQDLAEEYAVAKIPGAVGGVVIYAKHSYRDGWTTNPAARFLVRVLIEEAELVRKGNRSGLYSGALFAICFAVLCAYRATQGEYWLAALNLFFTAAFIADAAAHYYRIKSKRRTNNDTPRENDQPRANTRAETCERRPTRHGLL